MVLVMFEKSESGFPPVHRWRQDATPPNQGLSTGAGGGGIGPRGIDGVVVWGCRLHGSNDEMVSRKVRKLLEFNSDNASG